MKILYVHSYYAPDIAGGAERTLQTIVEGVASHGHSVSVFCTGRHESLHGELVGSARVYRAAPNNLYWNYEGKLHHPLKRAAYHALDIYNLAMAKSFRQVLDKEKPDLVCFHSLSGISISVWFEAFRRSIPTIQVLHDLYLACPTTSMFRDGASCAGQCTRCGTFRPQFRELSRRLSAVVGVSDYILGKMSGLEYFEGVRKVRIYNARPIADSPVPDPPSPSAPLRYGFIGSLTPAKGVEWLIKEFIRVQPGGTLAIAGRGDTGYVTHLKAIASNAPVKFLGQVSAQSFFSSVDVSVVPSQWNDTFPAAAFEASAYHVPLIASSLGGLPEIVDDEVNGLLCDPASPSSLGDAMKRLEGDRSLYRKMAVSARSHVADLVNPERMVGDYLKLYESIGRQP